MFRSWRDLSVTLGNVAALLKDGGFWCGLCFDSGEIFTRTPTPNPSAPSQKNYFYTPNQLVRVEMRQMAQFSQMDPLLLSPKPGQLFSEWVQTAPVFNIDFSVTMEKQESLYLVHTQTLIDAAKSFGLRCHSFRNLSDFFLAFKNREDDQLNKLQVYTKELKQLLPEQREAAALLAVFVFQKCS